METLDNKRARLRHELQKAYDTWLQTSESCAARRSITAPLDISGCRQAAQAEWFKYLVAKQRLLLTYSEEAVVL